MYQKGRKYVALFGTVAIVLRPWTHTVQKYFESMNFPTISLLQTTNVHYDSAAFTPCLLSLSSSQSFKQFIEKSTNKWQRTLTIHTNYHVNLCCKYSTHSIVPKWIGHSRFHRQKVIIINVIVSTIVHKYETQLYRNVHVQMNIEVLFYSSLQIDTN